MKSKKLLLILLAVAILSIPIVVLAEEPGDINYNRTKFRFGDTIYFNWGDNFCVGNPLDENKYIFPHVYDSQHMKRGIFINVKDYGFPPGGATAYRMVTIAYVDNHGEGMTITRHVTNWIPQQRTVILNW